LRPDGTPSGTIRRRVALGIRLYQEGAATLLVMSGGGSGPAPEAEIMARLAEAAGVPRSALLVEAKSNNTVENALFCVRLLRDRGIRRIVLVSDRVHLPRAAMLFRLAGLDVVGSAGAPMSSWTAALVAVLHEMAALPRSMVRILCARRRLANL
jgi:uncharacterized SAM-binding protein YcdF (DUF218 family)